MACSSLMQDAASVLILFTPHRNECLLAFSSLSSSLKNSVSCLFLFFDIRGLTTSYAALPLLSTENGEKRNTHTTWRLGCQECSCKLWPDGHIGCLSTVAYADLATPHTV